MSSFLETIEGMQNILGICPCCGELFRLAEAKLILPMEKPKPSLYGELVRLETAIERDRNVIEQEESDFEAQMDLIKQERIEAGRQSAYQQLCTVDPYFSGRGVNPRVVKVLFHPVEHVVFHCIDEGSEDGIELVSRQPKTKLQETIVRTIDRTIQSGNVEYHLLRVQNDGQFETTTNLRGNTRQRVPHS